MIYNNVKSLIEKHGGYWFRNDIEHGIRRGLRDVVSNANFGNTTNDLVRPIGWANDTYAYQSNGYSRRLKFTKPKLIPDDKFSIRLKVRTNVSPHGGITLSPFLSTVNSVGNSGIMIGVDGRGYLRGYSRIRDTSGNIDETQNVFGGVGTNELYIGDYRWHDILIVKEETKITVYVDDFKSPAYISSKNIKPYKHSGNLSILNSEYLPSIYFNGMVDDIQIFHAPVFPTDLEMENYYYTDTDNNHFSVNNGNKITFTETKENIFNYAFEVNQTKIGQTVDPTFVPDRLRTGRETVNKKSYVVEDKTNTENGVLFKHKIKDIFKTISVPQRNL